MTASGIRVMSPEPGMRSPELEAVCEAVRASEHIKWCSLPGRTSMQCNLEGCTTLSLPSGILDYEPSEYTITALAGTPVREVIATLASKGQYFPFDPMFSAEGATVGDMIASGSNGPGRLRYGGIRDFIIGIQFVDGNGAAIRGGGKVVKNAAGFDFPKLMAGSLGKLGVITEAAFKVFPRPAATLTAVAAMKSLPSAVDLAVQIARGPFDADAVEVLPGGRVIVRLAGSESALQPRLQFMRQKLAAPFDLMPESESFWKSCLSWSGENPPPNLSTRIKIPTTPSSTLTLDAALHQYGATRRYSVACGIAFIGWPQGSSLDEIHQLLRSLKLSGLNLSDDNSPALIGHQPGLAFLARVKRVLDPHNKFGDFA